MKVIFVSVVTIIVCALLILKKAYRKQILWGYVLIIVLFSAYYNLRILGTIMSFHRPTLQTFYQEDYLQTGEYPDSLLPLLLEGKTVYTKDDGYAYFEDATIEGKNWLYGFYHKTNTVSYLQFLRANVISDAEMNGTMLSDSQIREEFFQLGPANDMFRYMFVLRRLRTSWAMPLHITGIIPIIFPKSMYFAISTKIPTAKISVRAMSWSSYGILRTV